MRERVITRVAGTTPSDLHPYYIDFGSRTAADGTWRTDLTGYEKPVIQAGTYTMALEFPATSTGCPLEARF